MTISSSLPALDHLYLEDSCFLGIQAVGSDLRLRVSFVLTIDHPSYTPPEPGEQHCYREGDIVVSGIKITKWRAGRAPTILIGPDADIDLGSIAIGQDGAGYWVETDWFEMSFQADAVNVILDAGPR